MVHIGEGCGCIKVCVFQAVELPGAGAPVNERVRGALEETLDSTRHLIEETVFIHVEVADGISSVTPPEGVRPCYIVMPIVV